MYIKWEGWGGEKRVSGFVYLAFQEKQNETVTNCI